MYSCTDGYDKAEKGGDVSEVSYTCGTTAGSSAGGVEGGESKGTSGAGG